MPSMRHHAAFLALLMAGCQWAEDATSPGRAGPASTGQVTLVSTTGPTCIGSFALGGPNIYWTTPTNVMSTPKTGGALTTLAALGLSEGDTMASGFAVSGATAYWVDPRNQGDALMAAPITGGAAAMLSPGLGLSTNATSASFFFLWGTKIMTVPPGGSTFTPMATGNYWAITADGQSVYAIPSDGTTLVSIPVRGGTPVTVATLPAGSTVLDLVTDGAYVYWIDAGTSNILRVPVGGGNPTTVFEPDASDQCPSSLAVDGKNAYWNESCASGGGRTSTLWKMPVEGGTPVRFATSSSESGGLIAVDEASVYWRTGPCDGEETIVKITPK